MREHKKSGEGAPVVVAVVLVMLMLFCAVSEYLRVWVVAQGVKEAAQEAVISALNDNYDDVYHAVREGYAGGWMPAENGAWNESIDEGNIYATLSRLLDLSYEDDKYIKYADGVMEFAIFDLSVEVLNNALASGVSEGYTAVAQFQLDVPICLFGSLSRTLNITLHAEAKYVPLF